MCLFCLSQILCIQLLFTPFMKLYRFSCHDIKMCILFWIFDPIIFDGYGPFCLRISICQAYVWNYSYIICRNPLKIYRFSDYYMSKYICSWIFVSAIFNRITALLDLELCPPFKGKGIHRFWCGSHWRWLNTFLFASCEPVVRFLPNFHRYIIWTYQRTE